MLKISDALMVSAHLPGIRVVPLEQCADWERDLFGKINLDPRLVQARLMVARISAACCQRGVQCMIPGHFQLPMFDDEIEADDDVFSAPETGEYEVKATAEDG